LDAASFSIFSNVELLRTEASDRGAAVQFCRFTGDGALEKCSPIGGNFAAWARPRVGWNRSNCGAEVDPIPSRTRSFKATALGRPCRRVSLKATRVFDLDQSLRSAAWQAAGSRRANDQIRRKPMFKLSIHATIELTGALAGPHPNETKMA
jgi:hypothetical protein